MSNHRIPQSTSPTLKSLIKQKIKLKNLSRAELVSAIGYSNISKGCRRLQIFLNTIEAPSEQFITKITAVLEIDPVTFYRAIKASLDQFSADTKGKFKPYVEILLGIQIRPLFAAQMIRNQCSMHVPSKLQDQPLEVEIRRVERICRNHIDSVLVENLRKHVVGFKYHREHKYYLKFGPEFVLEETVFIQPRPPGKILLGNRIADLLSSGGIG